MAETTERCIEAARRRAAADSGWPSFLALVPTLRR